MNNLYGWPLSNYLLYGEFKWLKNVYWFDINWISEKSRIGYIFDVDLEYLEELHELHNDYPFALENLGVSYEMSDYCKKFADKFGIKVGDVMKLVPNLDNKTNYVLHYRDLQLHLSSGMMELAKIHRVLKLKQSDWMKKYIDFSTEKRKQCS